MGAVALDLQVHHVFFKFLQLDRVGDVVTSTGLHRASRPSAGPWRVQHGCGGQTHIKPPTSALAVTIERASRAAEADGYWAELLAMAVASMAAADCWSDGMLTSKSNTGTVCTCQTQQKMHAQSSGSGSGTESGCSSNSQFDLPRGRESIGELRGTDAV